MRAIESAVSVSISLLQGKKRVPAVMRAVHKCQTAGGKKTGHVVVFFTGCCQIHDLFLKSVETHGQFAIGFGSPAQELGLECELFWWKRD